MEEEKARQLIKDSYPGSRQSSLLWQTPAVAATWTSPPQSRQSPAAAKPVDWLSAVGSVTLSPEFYFV